MTNTNYEIIKLNISIMLSFLVIIISILEIDYNSVNLFIKKNIKLKLILDILFFIILCYYFVTSKYIFVRILFFVLILTALLMVADTLNNLCNIKNKFIAIIYGIMIKVLVLIYLPFRIKNKILYKLYNVPIEKEDLPYLNMPLILILMLQSMVFVIVISTNIENICNKYFFGFAISTFVSYFSIDIYGCGLSGKNKNVNKYIFVLKKSFLIILMIELILVASIVNINYSIISKLSIIKQLRLNEKSLKELFDSITLCTLVLQLIEYRNKLDQSVVLQNND